MNSLIFLLSIVLNITGFKSLEFVFEFVIRIPCSVHIPRVSVSINAMIVLKTPLPITLPISITSVLSKVFERLVSVRHGRFMEHSGVLTTTQFAYR